MLVGLACSNCGVTNCQLAALWAAARVASLPFTFLELTQLPSALPVRLFVYPAPARVVKLAILDVSYAQILLAEPVAPVAPLVHLQLLAQPADLLT